MSSPPNRSRLLMSALAIATGIVCAGSYHSNIPDERPSNQTADANSVIVEEVYPTTDELPENLLRFYIYFSKPMRPDVARRSILLTDENGNKIDDAFLDTSAGLWSSDRRRLTVLLNPGRIKTGLDSSDTMGPAIRAGSQYTLIIGVDATALDGSTVAEPHLKRFRVTDPDRESPRPDEWTLSHPRRNSRDPLIVNLDMPADHASLAFRVRVIDGTGGVVSGRLELGHHEQRWTLTPDEPWAADDYSLRVEHELEDLAGNRPGRLFEDRGDIEVEHQAYLIPIFVAPPRPCTHEDPATDRRNIDRLLSITTCLGGTEP